MRVVVAAAQLVAWAPLVAAAAAPTAPTFNETEARIYMQYARASFCSAEHLERWDCGEMCKAAAVVPGSVRFLCKTPFWQGQGYVAEVSPGPLGRRCVAAFRGTVDVMNWIGDFSFWRTPWPNWAGADPALCPGCEVHDGVAQSYLELRPALHSAIRELGCRQVSFAGHSLGAGLVTLASLDVRMGLGLRVDPVFAFAKLRIGNLPFVKAYVAAAKGQGVSPPMWRVVDFRDPVPRIPMAALGYVHEPQEVYYPEKSLSRFRVCNWSPELLEDPTCSAAVGILGCLGNPAVDHNSYMNLSTTELPKPCASDAPQAGREHICSNRSIVEAESDFTFV